MSVCPTRAFSLSHSLFAARPITIFTLYHLIISNNKSYQKCLFIVCLAGWLVAVCLRVYATDIVQPVSVSRSFFSFTDYNICVWLQSTMEIYVDQYYMRNDKIPQHCDTQRMHNKNVFKLSLWPKSFDSATPDLNIDKWHFLWKRNASPAPKRLTHTARALAHLRCAVCIRRARGCIVIGRNELSVVLCQKLGALATMTTRRQQQPHPIRAKTERDHI